MARVTNEAAYAARRNAILDAAQRAIATTGYEQMAIADLLSELKISSGAFYHYFESKPALLMALVARMGDEVEQLVLPIIHNPTLGALDKLQRFFDTLDQGKLAHKHLVLAYIRVWYADENAIVRNKLYIARIKRLTPWLEEIILQGVREGVMTTSYPDQAARMVISLLEAMPHSRWSSRWNTHLTTCLASNASSRPLLMRWNACWEHQRAACSALRSKNSRSGWSRPLARKQNRSISLVSKRCKNVLPPGKVREPE